MRPPHKIWVSYQCLLMQSLHEPIVARCHHSHRWFIERGYLVTWNLWPLSLHHHRWQRISNFIRRRSINEIHWWQKYTPIGRHASNSCSPNDSGGAGVSWCVLSGAVLCLINDDGPEWHKVVVLITWLPMCPCLCLDDYKSPWPGLQTLFPSV